MRRLSEAWRQVGKKISDKVPGKKVSREEIVWCYRALLGREPASEAEILAFAGCNSFQNLVGHFARAPEFLAKTGAAADKTPAWWATPQVKMLLLGSCQVVAMAKLIRAMTYNEVAADALQLAPAVMEQLHSGQTDLAALVAENDLIAVQSNFTEARRMLEQAAPHAQDKIRLVPGIHFAAFHPDLVYVRNRQSGHVGGPMGGYQSSIAFYGWRQGLSVRETVGLFAEEVFDALGFFDYWDSSMASLAQMGKDGGVALAGLAERWFSHGCWMHSINHPKLFVLADVAGAVLAREGLAVQPGAEQFVYDEFADSAVWPVYPEIGRKLGIPGHYRFHKPHGKLRGRRAASVVGLEEFVRASFNTFSKCRREDLVCDRLDSPRYHSLEAFLKSQKRSPPAAKGAGAGRSNKPLKSNEAAAHPAPQARSRINPYQQLPDYQFWRRAVERLPARDIDPVTAPRFTLAPDDKVATAGSCFAQHIARILRQNGLNYYLAERADGLAKEEARRRNFGVFSARYGNVYTARQLLQLFDRAHGAFTPKDRAWTRLDGKLADPFRPQVEPDGFATLDELEASRAAHLAAVRELFESLDVFVFTLGLTEAWRSRLDGAVYPVAPGVAAGGWDPKLHEFVNFGVAEVASDLQAFLERLLGVNPKARVILTVSPVPLVATYEDRHVLVATTYSKSVLRAAADEVARRNPACDYFPAYEIVTGNHARGGYFEDDLRSVRQEGVDHVMRMFVAHYADGAPRPVLSEELLKENARAGEIVCDEEAIDAAGNGL